MKKILLFSLLLISVIPTFAQLQKTAVIDFTNPTKLNPAVDVSGIKYTNGTANVGRYTFFSGDISMSFSAGTGAGGFGAYVRNYLHDGNTDNFALDISQNTRITFEALNGATLNAIEFDNLSSRGGLSLDNGQPGKFTNLKWSTDDTNIHSVTLVNYSTHAKLCIVTISYTAPQNVLVPSASIYDGEILTSFRSISLTFPNNVTAVNTSGITIEGTGIRGYDAMSTSVSGRTVTLSLQGYQIDTDGDYVITVPEGSFRDSEGYCNAELTYRFSVREPRNTFNVLSVDPTNGSTMEVLQFPIVLTFPNEETNYVGYVNTDKTIYLRRQGVSAPIAQIHPVLGDNGSVLLQVNGSVTSFATGGTYTLTVDEGTVYNQMYGTDYARYNQAVSLTYYVVEPVDPLKDLKDEAARLKSKIASDLGYPSRGSEAANMLNNVTAQDANPTKEDLEAAIAAFYTETDVVMPTEGLWYNIIGVNSNGNKVYLAYSNGKVSLTKSSSDAAAFQLSKDGDDYSFMTADGKYLMSLSDGNNVTEKGKASKLTLAKLLVSGVDATKQLGLFSIYGWLGRDANDADLGYSYATIDHSSTAIAKTPVTKLNFSTKLSSGFKFAETDDPTYIEPIYASMSLSSTSVLLGTTPIVLYLDNINHATLKDSSKPYFSSDANGSKRVASATLTEDGWASFTVSLNGLAAGTYYLQLPAGTFDYSQNDVPVIDQANALQFVITEPASEFNTTYTNYVVLQVMERNSHSIDVIRDVDLNDFVIMAQIPKYYTALVPDPTAEVQIKNYYNGRVVGRGHFETYSNFAKDYPQYSKDGYKAIKLVMTQPVEAGDLQYTPDTYGYKVPEAAFGDSKFKDYLAGKTGVKKSDCIVNAGGNLAYFLVDNDRATGIVQINSADVRETKIYDLTGRRVEGKAKKGVYIVNGKKVMIK